MRPFSNQAMKGNATEIQAEAKTELLQWVWGPFNFERLVVISLILQFILFFGAPFRKSTANCVVLTLIWSAYLLADWVSYYSIGLVLNGETGRDTNHLHILWGSLMLAHISGPDTISVLDMEDHYLWSRTALKFGTIAYSIARVTTKTFSHKGNGSAPEFHRSTNISHAQAHKLLYVPTGALFMVGIVKSLEKIATLLVNRTSIFQDRVIRKIHDPTHQINASLVQGAVLLKVRNKPMIPRRGELSPFEALRDAYQLFRVFRGCYVDFKLEFGDEDHSIKEYFLDRTPQDAFLVIETELNLMYDVFYTKASHFRKVGVRFVRYLAVIAEFVAFGCLATEQLNDISNWFDVPITHALILGALFMDTIATLQIIFSIRTILPTDDQEWSDFSFRGWLLNKLLSLQRRTWGEYSSPKEISYPQRIRRVLFRRWSESISQFNFIDYCLRRQPRWLQSVCHYLGVKEKIHKATYVDHVWFTDSLRNFIFDELKDKARLLQNLDSRLSGLYVEWIAGKELDKCLLIWHIATDFCWTDSDGDGSQCRQWSKTLSDYMLCLLIQHPKMLNQPELGLMGRLRLESACESFQKAVSSTPNYHSWLSKRDDEARQGMLNQMRGNNRMDEVVIEGNPLAERLREMGMDEVVIEGNQLAEHLKDMGSQKWEIASKVWVELLCRTASKTKPSAHIRTLNKGGELLTLVWLLMNHLGIDNRGRALETQTL